MSGPVVTVAGKQYAVPPLVPKQQRIIIPALMKIAAAMRTSGGVVTFDPSALTVEMMDGLYDCIFWGAVWPNDKQSQRSSIDELNIPFYELLPAISVIRQQTGLFQAAPEGATLGE